MQLGDWLKPPRSILTFYLAGAAVALLCLTWLALRQLAQDEVVEAQRVRLRLEAIADRVVARLQQAVNEIERGLTTDVDAKPGLIVVTVSPEHIQIRSGSLPFVPVAPESTPVPDSVFAAGDAAEFAGAKTAQAAVVYRALAEQSKGATRAGALARLARVLRRADRIDEALDVYDTLADMPAVVIDGRPSDLIARRGRCATLEAAGRNALLVSECGELRRDLTRGRWAIGRDLWEAVFAEATRWAGHADSAMPHLEADLAAARALDRLWADRENVALPRRLMVDDEAGATLVVWSSDGNILRVVLAGSQYVEALWKQLANDPDVDIQLTDPSGGSAVGRAHAAGIRRIGADTSLPWNVLVSDANPQKAVAEGRSRRLFFVGGLGLMGLLIVGSGYFTFRGIRRELAMAEQQSEFVSAASHELRTPITSIRQLSHMLQRGRVESDSRRIQYDDVLVRESERLHRLVERLLSIGRAEAGRYRFEPVDVTEFAVSVVDEFRAQVPARAVALRTPDGNHSIRADRDMLSLALWNLLDNAAKYSPEGTPIEVVVAAAGDGVSIAVTDRGRGIAPADQSRIFEKFVRGSDPAAPVVTGSGLGLALVDRIVRAHRGTIRIASELGSGSTFTIRVTASAREVELPAMEGRRLPL